jgi:hypothetical protein
MLTPKELYETYSASPCKEDNGFYPNPFYGNGSYGAGTPHYMRRVVQFMKHLKYPCIKDAPGYKNGTNNNIRNTGAGKIGLPFKILQSLDSECFTEIQPTIDSGTSHSIRNACDISRACTFVSSGLINQWKHRMATEYMQYFGSNSLSDCLMTLGPDLVPEEVAYFGRAPNIEQSIPDTYAGMACLPTELDNAGATGANWSCMTPPNAGETPPKCRSCDYCPDPPDPANPCCRYGQGSVDYQNYCCKAPLTTRPDFGYLISNSADTNTQNVRPRNIYPLSKVDNFNIITNWSANSITLTQSEISTYTNIIANLRLNESIVFKNNEVYVYTNPSYNDKYDIRSYTNYMYKMRYVGLLPRDIYGGYANLLNNSGSNFYSIIDDIFLDYVQNRNGFINTLTPNIYRARTISMLSADVNEAAASIKDLLWNGYGIVLFSNVGFPNSRDSRGLSYPDRMWYTTYSIIGYDDTKIDYNECVYVLSCPWGKWNNGGEPIWGPLPDGCFLVTETHLKCMLKVYADRDYYGCRSKLPCNPVLYDCDSPTVLRELAGCGNHGPAEKCEPYFCASQQKAMGLAFAVSLNEGFPKQTLDHYSYLPIRKIKEKFKEQPLYYKYS